MPKCPIEMRDGEVLCPWCGEGTLQEERMGEKVIGVCDNCGASFK